MARSQREDRGSVRPTSRGRPRRNPARAWNTKRGLRAIQYVTETALSRLEPDILLKELLRRIREVLAGDTAAILLLSQDGRKLVAHASDGLEEEAGEEICLPVDRGIAGLVAARKRPMILNDLSETEVSNPIMHGKIRSLVAAPLLLRDQLLGVVHVGTAQRRPFTKEDLGFLEVAADLAALAIERGQADEARSELSAIVESSEDAIIGLSLEGTIASWNPGAERLYGYAAKEAVGEPFSIILPPDRGGELSDVLTRLRNGEVIKSYDSARMRRDGNLIDVSATISAIKDTTGKVVGASTIARDITERKRAERDRLDLLSRERSARAEAETERARLETILESAPSGVVFCDAETGHVTANPRAFEFLGWAASPELRLGQLVGHVCHPDGRVLPLDELLLSRALRGHATSDQELLLVRAGETRTPVLASAAPVRNARGGVIGAVALYQDISRVKEMEQMREEWTSIIAHDMRQPLAIVMGYAATLRGMIGQRASSEFEIRAVEHIISASGNLNRIIGDLLDASRLETRRLKLEKERIDLPALVRDFVDRAAAITGGHSVRVEVQDPIPPIDADPARVEQVLGNLLSNAGKYGYPNTETLVRLWPIEGEVEVSVANEGEGIPIEERARLFTRFHRTRSAERGPVKGLGLGLYISKGLVEAHGGRIWVDSVPKKTTAFHFTLPVARA